MFRSLKRSLSEGNILCESNSPIEATDVGQKEDNCTSLPAMTQGDDTGLSESTPDISTCDGELAYPRCACITISNLFRRGASLSLIPSPVMLSLRFCNLAWHKCRFHDL